MGVDYEAPVSTAFEAIEVELIFSVTGCKLAFGEENDV